MEHGALRLVAAGLIHDPSDECFAARVVAFQDCADQWSFSEFVFCTKVGPFAEEQLAHGLNVPLGSEWNRAVSGFNLNVKELVLAGVRGLVQLKLVFLDCLACACYSLLVERFARQQQQAQLTHGARVADIG